MTDERTRELTKVIYKLQLRGEPEERERVEEAVRAGDKIPH